MRVESAGGHGRSGSSESEAWEIVAVAAQASVELMLHRLRAAGRQSWPRPDRRTETRYRPRGGPDPDRE